MTGPSSFSTGVHHLTHLSAYYIDAGPLEVPAKESIA